MASSSPARKGTRSKPIKDRRSGASGATTPLRKLKGLLVRPIGLERHDGKLKVVLAERRRPRPANEQPSLALLCAELSARMLTHEADETARTMRHLILVHDALERRGWAGVETMSSLVRIWRRPVSLSTQIDGKRAVLRYDGKEHGVRHDAP